MYYPEELVEEVRARNDIVDVISGYVSLKKKGSNYWGCCPFHNEKTPSFSVSSNKQMYYCFGCHASGNVYTFLMKYENDTFPEAIKILADRAGVKLPEVEETPEQKKKAGKRMRLLEVNKEAAKYFYYMLRDPRGEVGMRYLTGRKLTDDHASFRTGLCREKRRAGGTVPAEKGLYGRRDQRLRTGNVF